MINWSTYFNAARLAEAKQYGVQPLFNVTAEPISMEMARAHLKIDVFGSPPQSDDDFWIETIGIPGARAGCEGWLGVSIAQQSYQLSTNGFPIGTIILPFGPVQSITTVTYIDPDGDIQIVPEEDYVLDGYANPATLSLATGATWPETESSAQSVLVEYVAGYFDATASPPMMLPAGIMIGVLLELSHLNSNREATTPLRMMELPIGVEWHLEPFRRRLSMA